MKIIARVHSDFTTKFGIPRQSGLVNELESILVFEPEYRNEDALRGLVDFTHIWILWQFSESMRETWSPTVRPPRLGGNERVGVFATRSPFRPNAIGLSSVRLLGVEKHSQYGMVIRFAGGDMLDGTPVLDIKPYLPYVDSHPDAKGGFAEERKDYALDVVVSEELLQRVPKEKQQALRGVLAGDPRPSYQNDPDRVYGMEFAGLEVKFRVQDSILYVVKIDSLR